MVIAQQRQTHNTRETEDSIYASEPSFPGPAGSEASLPDHRDPTSEGGIPIESIPNLRDSTSEGGIPVESLPNPRNPTSEGGITNTTTTNNNNNINNNAINQLILILLILLIVTITTISTLMIITTSTIPVESLPNLRDPTRCPPSPGTEARFGVGDRGQN